ncbi:Na(+)-translocating NADH-quinone reductase subunit A [Aquimarina sp. ERC-38]|uniref:Na(+)-translocating NADH-quinone reductase subunit A n=1 Tax=Aquimarina sp. ERC-38 TaxID=2949996 RepID=UPI0022466AE9|nr:Na(+)-translocating NADH-quinone reductase subunit A [Aquimarina sp. ERC-38]UZO82566.1 Na(+)-translocating NADH-quinone reductase subunit A [Aquimarina sp. ERC-38]
MSKDIRIRKGLDIKLVGAAEKTLSEATRSNIYAIRPDDFHGIIPKIVAREGSEVKAGQALFHDKANAELLFPSPVSGEVVEIVRGAKRKILLIKILADKQQDFFDHGVKNLDSLSREEIISHLLSSGCWPFIKQRPYDVIANPAELPKSIFISGYATAPLATDLDFALSGKEKELQTAVTALSKLTEGAVHISIGKKDNSPLSGLQNAVIHKVSGQHPAGNVGVQIGKIDPINKGETVWVVQPQDLVIIGELLLTGKFNAERIVAVAGSSIKKPQYYKAKIGAEVATMIYDAGVNENNIRVISGDVLTGVNVKPDGYLGFYNNLISVIPEGNDYEFFGWNKPVFDKVSVTRSLTFSWLMPNKKYKLDTNTNGEHRAFVITGIYEDVFPMDIYPLQLLKACLVSDLDAMEQLGMYEVAPEDFALTEFVCISKQPHQQIIREGLDLMIKEIG